MNFYVTENILLYLTCTVIIGNGNQNQLHDTVIFLDKILYSHRISDKFLSFAMDSSLLRNSHNFKNLTTNSKFINLAHHLKPAYIRVGGNLADCIYFNQTDARENLKINSRERNYTNFALTSETFLSLYAFSRKIESRLMFDLNVLLRNSDGSWNSTNAEEIISFSRRHELKLDWQLGNEPNSFRYVFNISISPEQLADDYCTLRKILNNSGYQTSILVGPEANHIGINESGNKYVTNFMKKCGNCIDFVTWHQYYLDGKTAKKEDFFNASVFERLPLQINVMEESVKLAGKNHTMWISETSSAYGGGAPGLSDRYIAGFLWLDKLGYSAKVGVQVVIRQTLFGGHYSLIGDDLEPNADWWVSILFKTFVSSKVLKLSSFFTSDTVRLYAHCTPKEAPGESEIVIYGMNLNNEERVISFKDAPEKSKMRVYILTSNDLQSRDIFLNGEILKLQINGSLPHFDAETMDAHKPVKLPPYSMVFLLMNGLDIPQCEK